MILYDALNSPTLAASIRLDALKKVVADLVVEDDDLIIELLEILVEYESDDYFGTEGFEL